MALSGIFPSDLVGARYEETSTTALFALGTVSVDNEGGRWRYVQANGALTIYDAVKIDNDFQAVQLTTTVSGSEPTNVGIAQVAFSDNEYGFVFEGPGGGLGSGIKVNTLASAVADSKMYTTGTAGAIDDTATDLIQGLTIVTTNGGSTAAVECYAACKLVTNAQD